MQVTDDHHVSKTSDPASSFIMASLRWAGRLDMYRKVPADLMEGTRRGSILSLGAVAVMLTLFLLETSAFFRRMYVMDCQGISVFPHYCDFRSKGDCSGFSVATANVLSFATGICLPAD
jgi:Endoplasmic Reticulum-Golgi Intermediate Compartment (ERGIC)